MYKYPYGDSQQLNLDWILAKLKELEASGGSGGADLEEVSNALISLTYNTSTAYRRYDYAFLNGKLYRCLSDTSGVFDPSAWQEALIGDDLSVLTRWINAIDAAAVVDVKFDTSGTNGKIQQKYNDQYHDVVEVDYTPVQYSKRPLSSNAGYELNGAITSLDTQTNSINWTPANNDTILAFIIASCERTKLPFSFVKVSTNTVSDAPTAIQSKEFTGFVYGNGDRITVQINHYTNNISAFFQRTIYQNNWLATSWVEYKANVVETGTPINPIITASNVDIFKNGKSVFVNLREVNAVSGTGTWLTYFSIASEFMPPYSVRFMARDLATGTLYNGRVLSTGEVQLNIPSDTTANAFFSVCYITFNG